jgi:putative endonuclease
MAKTAKRTLGDLGEGVAARYLAGKGFEIIERNYLRPWGEIDIVATKAKKLYFIEVKTVTREPGQRTGFRPEENMHAGKIQRLQRAIQTYLAQKRSHDAEWQLDLACVYLDLQRKRARVDMIENVF